MTAKVSHLQIAPKPAENWYPESEVWRLVEAVSKGTADAARSECERLHGKRALRLVSPS